MTDTPQKRGAALNTGAGVTVLPTPDGSVDAEDRAQLTHSYEAASEPVPETVIVPPRSRIIYAGRPGGRR